MVIYTVIADINNDILEEWYDWMQEDHIPKVLGTGFFTGCRFLKQEGQLNGEKTTHMLQYTAKSKKGLEEYVAKHSPRLQKEHTDLYGGKFFIISRGVFEEIGDINA